MSISDLRDVLKLHRRLRSHATEDQKQAGIAVLHYITRNFPQFNDWRELVKHADEFDHVGEDLSTMVVDEQQAHILLPVDGPFLPPPCKLPLRTRAQ